VSEKSEKKKAPNNPADSNIKSTSWAGKSWKVWPAKSRRVDKLISFKDNCCRSKAKTALYNPADGPTCFSDFLMLHHKT
jgi:hypothetical protein